LKRFFAAASISALSFTAFMASPVNAAPAPYNWTGFYVGAVAGAGVNTPVIDDYDCNLACTSLSIGNFGGTIGGTVGGNYQFASNGVVGLEGDFSGAFFKSSADSVDWPSYHSSSTSWLVTVRGRAGLAVDRALVYVTGGLAEVDQTTKGSSNANFSCTGEHCFNVSGAKAGAALGAGVEYALTDNWTMKAEFLDVIVPYSTVRDTGTDCTTEDYCNFRVSSSMQVARLGVNYKF
jgi:outer membrane immunogenic protein